jgi:hypothetical protein
MKVLAALLANLLFLLLLHYQRRHLDDPDNVQGRYFNEQEQQENHSITSNRMCVPGAVVELTLSPLPQQ